MTLRGVAVLAMTAAFVSAGCNSTPNAPDPAPSAEAVQPPRLTQPAPSAQEVQASLGADSKPMPRMAVAANTALPESATRRERPVAMPPIEPGADPAIVESVTMTNKDLHGYAFPGVGVELDLNSPEPVKEQTKEQLAAELPKEALAAPAPPTPIITREQIKVAAQTGKPIAIEAAAPAPEPIIEKPAPQAAVKAEPPKAVEAPKPVVTPAPVPVAEPVAVKPVAPAQQPEGEETSAGQASRIHLAAAEPQAAPAPPPIPPRIGEEAPAKKIEAMPLQLAEPPSAPTSTPPTPAEKAAPPAATPILAPGTAAELKPAAAPAPAPAPAPEPVAAPVTEAVSEPKPEAIEKAQKRGQRAERRKKDDGAPKFTMDGHVEAAPAMASNGETLTQMPEPDFSRYEIGAGDVMDFQCYSDTTLSKPVTVRFDGHISLPLVSDVAVSGHTREEAEEMIRAAYRSVFRDPQVSLMITSPASKTYTIVGDVTTQGVFPYTRTTTLIDAISMAGGLRQRSSNSSVGGFVGITGQLTKAFVIRKVKGERHAFQFDLRGLGHPGAHASETPIYYGDVIYVPEGVNLVYLLGESRNQVIVELTEGMTLLQLMSLAGGFNESTARLRSVVLIRQVDGDRSKVMLVNVRQMLRGAHDIRLNPGDIVYIPRKYMVTITEFVQRFTGSISPLLNMYTDAVNAYYAKTLTQHAAQQPEQNRTLAVLGNIEAFGTTTRGIVDAYKP